MSMSVLDQLFAIGDRRALERWRTYQDQERVK